MKSVLQTTILLAICFILAVSAFAQVPMYFGYQGRLTDDTGEPITNTSPGVQMTFTIYNDPLGTGATFEEWTSGPVMVPVEDGLFDYQLGPLSVALYTDLVTGIDHWLGITIGADPEIDPRSKLASVPYALHAGSASSVPDIYVDEAGDIMTGDLVFDALDNTQTDARIEISSDWANLELFSSNTLTAKLWGQTYGELMLAPQSDGVTRAGLVAQTSGGALGLFNGIPELTHVIDAGLPGDASVVFPFNSINSYEILDEPGIANNATTDYVTLTTTMGDLQTVTIEIPEAGYIYLEGWCCVSISGATTKNHAHVQIDETSGGGSETGYYTSVGMDTYPSAGFYNYQIYINRIYYKDAGSYDFILEGEKWGSAHTINCFYPNLTATYYPTSYTPIKAFSSDPSGYPEAEPVAAVDVATGETKTVYEIDLRKLELEAKEAKIKALEAEMKLRQAQEALRDNQ
jgi:hypothetical protein